MKERLTDVLSLLERMVRGWFYVGAGIYLGAKALIIIPQHPGIPDVFTVPAALVAFYGGLILGIRVSYEPTPKELREAKKKAELNDEILRGLSKEVLGRRYIE